MTEITSRDGLLIHRYSVESAGSGAAWLMTVTDAVDDDEAPARACIYIAADAVAATASALIAMITPAPDVRQIGLPL